MNNKSVETSLSLCNEELEILYNTINKNKFDSINQYLTKYSLIKACGTIEQAYKTIVVDFCSQYGIEQINNYIYKKVKKSSMNPSYDNLVSLLKDFDENWSKEFKDNIKNHEDSGKLKLSLKSLNSARNQFAHGGSPMVTIGDIKGYFEDAVIIIKMYDDIVYRT